MRHGIGTAAFALTVALSGCAIGTKVYLYPISGPEAVQTPVPVLTMTASGIVGGTVDLRSS
jgi:hypothetical protein